MTRKEFLRLTTRGAATAAAASSIGPIAHALPREAQPAHPLAAPPSGVTQAVVAFITGMSMDQVPPDVVGAAKRCLIDGFGVILAGATERGSEIVREYVRAVGGPGDASVLGPVALSASPALAALANGSSGHAMDYDDTQLSTTPDRVFGLLTHPTVPALSAALAVAERVGASGRAFLDAFITGFEVECKIAEAIHPEHYLRGFHSTGTIGTFAGAAAAARLLKLTPGQCAHALGIAASMSAGIRVNFGSMTKPLHAGRAAENGVVAAELASHGFTAGADGLDGEWGFFMVHGGGADVGRITPMLGRPWSIVSPGVSVKPYPCGSLGHPTMDAMLALVKAHDLRPDDVAQVRVRAGSNILNPLRYKTATTALEAKFCLPFMMASLLLRRRAGIREFTDEFVSSAPVQQLMARVETVFDQEIENRGFDKMRSRVEVTLKDGQTFAQASDERYRGGPEKPFTRDELHEKFADCAGLFMPEAQIRAALALIESIEQVPSVKQLAGAMSPAGRRPA